MSFPIKHGDFPVRYHNYVSLPEFIKGFFLGSTSHHR